MPKRLYRSRTDRVLAGVAGGIASYVNVDSIIVRLIWLALALAGGSGVILYLIAVVIIPSGPSEEVGNDDREAPARTRTGASVLIGAGLFLLLKDYLPRASFFGWTLPLLLIIAGIIVLVRARD